MATRRIEIDREELASLTRDALRAAEPEMLTLDELRDALADEEKHGVQAGPEELAEVLNALIVAREVDLRVGAAGVPAFSSARRPQERLSGRGAL